MTFRCANSRKARREQLRRMRGLRPEADHTAVKWFFAISVGLIVIGMAWAALAHGPADWINKGGYKNSAGEQCCGERDCFELADGDVKITASGYLIRSLNELVPFHQATPSPDGKFWRCAWGGQRKCFFAPPGST